RTRSNSGRCRKPLPARSRSSPCETASGAPARLESARRSGLSRVSVRARYGVSDRHGSLRRLGHAGRPDWTFTPGTAGRIRLDGILGENAIDSVAVPVGGCVWLKDQMGCVPLGAAIVTLIREPARYTCPS